MVHDPNFDVDLNPEPGTNVLFLGPSLDEDPELSLDHIYRLLRDASHGVFIIYNYSSQSVVDGWIKRSGGLPDQLSVISVDETIRSTAKPTETCQLSEVPITTVDSTNLVDLAHAINDVLVQWNTEPRGMLYFDSMSTLLQTAELETAFRFLHVLTTRTNHLDGIGFYYLDPTGHSDQTVNILSELFDTIVRIE